VILDHHDIISLAKLASIKLLE